MAKTVIRLLPDNLFYIGKLESWLNDMASKGLHLKDMHSRHAVFTRGNPAYKRYCITELPQYPEGDILREYNDAYWDRITSYNVCYTKLLRIRALTSSRPFWISVILSVNP